MSPDLQTMLAKYRSGLEPELALLRQLDALAARHAQPGARRTRHGVAAGRSRAQPGSARPPRREFQSVVALHNEAAAMVNRIMASDKQSMAALEQAEIARPSAAMAMEKGEATLQGYRRVITPSVNSTLVNRRG